MTYTIISNNCPLCIAAKAKFAGHDLEEFADWDSIPLMRRAGMRASLEDKGGDPDALPIMFDADDEYIDWRRPLMKRIKITVDTGFPGCVHTRVMEFEDGADETEISDAAFAFMDSVADVRWEEV